MGIIWTWEEGGVKEDAHVFKFGLDDPQRGGIMFRVDSEFSVGCAVQRIAIYPLPTFSKC